jgi:hypothetical protein
MYRLAPFLLAAASLSACNVHSKNPADTDGNVTIQADESGNIAFNLPIIQGQVKVPSGFMHNGNIDIDGVKLMPGSSVTGFSVFAADKGSNVTMTFAAPASPDEVRNYYADQFKKQGVEVAIAGNSVTGKSKDGSPFTIEVNPGANGSQGKIDIQDKD